MCIRAIFIVYRSTPMTEGQPVTSAKLNGACAGPNGREGKLDRYIYIFDLTLYKHTAIGAILCYKIVRESDGSAHIRPIEKQTHIIILLCTCHPIPYIFLISYWKCNDNSRQLVNFRCSASYILYLHSTCTRFFRSSVYV